MSSQKEDKELFPQGIISEAALQAYLHGELSEVQKQHFDKLLAEDPFAQEAMEGLREINVQAQTAPAILRIKKQVREKTGIHSGRGIQLHWSSYAWAAVVLGLLIGIGFLMVDFLGPKNQEIAQNTKAEQTNETTQVGTKPEQPAVTSVPLVSDTATLAQQANNDSTNLRTKATTVDKEIGKTEEQQQPLLALKKKEETKNITLSVPAENKTSAEKKAAPAMAPAANNKASMSTAPTTGVASPDRGTVNTMTENSTNEELALGGANKKAEVATLSNLVKSTALDEAMQSFNSGDYKTSSDRFDQVLKQDPDNADALYFGGISEYIEGNMAKSEKRFDKLLKQDNRYVEGSKWYKANILLKKGKKDAARKILEDLANNNSSYKERAAKKLKDMGN